MSGDRGRATEAVLVVGAGPVGMVVACELAQQGVPVRVVDASRRQSAHSRATVIWPRVLEVLRRVGVTDELVASGHRIDRVAYHSSGRRLAAVRFDRLASTPYPFAVTIPQSRTEEILEKRLAELGVTVERGVRLESIESDDHEVRAMLRSSHDGSLHSVPTPWLVGADGAHSTTRELLGLPFDGPELDVTFAITDAVIAGDLPESTLAYCWTPTGGLGLAPLGDRVFRIAVRVPDAMPHEVPDRAFFQAMIDRRGPGDRNVVGDLRFSTTFRLSVRTAAAFRAGRCFLAGDAAHTMSPAGGQGMNTGLQDAVNLGWKLAGVLSGGLQEDILRSYDRERRQAARVVSAATSRQTRWGGFTRRRDVALRDLALRAAGRSGLLQRRAAPFLSQLGLGYGTGDAPVRDGLPARPGDRVPVLPGTGAAPAGWWELSQDRFTVILWPGRVPPAGWEETCARLRAAVADRLHVVAPSAGSPPLRRALGPRAVAALVRPDGHLHALVAPSRPDELLACHERARRGETTGPGGTATRSKPDR